MKKIYLFFLILFLMISISINAQEQKDALEYRVNAVTQNAQCITNFGALLRGTAVTSNTNPWEAYFECCINASGESHVMYFDAEPHVYQSSTTRTITAVVYDLLPGTTYRFRLILEREGNIDYGNWQFFTTLNTKAQLTEGFEWTWPPKGWILATKVNNILWGKVSHYMSPAFEGWMGGDWNFPAGVDMGDYSAYCTYTTISRYNWTSQWLISPQLENVQVGDTISFWYGNAYRNFREYIEIRLSTTDNDTLSFTTLIDTFKYARSGVEEPATTLAHWRYESYDLSPWAGQDVYIAIKESESSWYDVRANMVDNFSYKGRMPQYGFSVDTNEAYVNQPIHFQAAGTPYSASWDFGDGTTGTGGMVTHTYSSPGWYSVTMNITGLDGNPYTMTRPSIVHVTSSACSFSGSPGLDRDALLPGETCVPLIKFNVKNQEYITQYLTGLTVNLTCTDMADVTSIKLYTNTTNSLPGATLLDSQDPASTLTYTLDSAIGGGATRYLWVTADISSNATIGNAIMASIPVNGASAGGNTYPFIAIAPNTPWIITDYVATLPENGTFANSATELVWTISQGSSFDGFLFNIQVDDDPTFASPEIDCVQSREYSYSQGISGLTGYESLVDGNTYYWRVMAITDYGTGNYTDGTNYFVWDSTNQPPEIPAGTFSPSQGVEVTTLNPVFAWSYATDPDDSVTDIKYRIRIATDSGMNNVILGEWTNPGQNLYQFSESLDDATDYYWQVRSADPADLRSAFSVVQHFRTNTAPVTATLPSPLTPPAGGGAQTFSTYGSTVASVNWESGDLPESLNLDYVAGYQYPTIDESETIVNRYWMFDATGGSSWQAKVRLYYSDSDLGPLAADEALLKILKTDNSGQAWDAVTITGRNTDENWIEGRFSSFSDVILTGPETTLPIQLSSFTGAFTTDGLVTLNWITQSECGVLGYRILRSENELLAEAFNMTPELISATGATSTYEYEWTDLEVEGQETLWYWLESIDYDATSNFFGPIRVTLNGEEDPDETPDATWATEFVGTYPNPFNPVTTIEYSLKQDELVTFEMFDLKGRKVDQIKQNGCKGSNSLSWNADDMATGVYFIRMTAMGMQEVRKVMLLK